VVTPLHWASCSRDLARLLIERGADAAAQDKHGWTRLHRASSAGNLDLSQLLIEHGADAAAQDEHGWTPLHQVSERSDVDLARLLIEQR